jgi:hypothetical protein
MLLFLLLFRLMQKLMTNTVPRLDVFLLYRQGALINGVVSKWQWPLPTMTITVTARADGHRLFLRIDDGDEIAYGIITRPGTTGGSYPFLACTCERSARYLYIHENRIACRICHDLVWPADRWTYGTRAAIRRVDRARAKLAVLEHKLFTLSQRRRPGSLPVLK